MNLLRIAARVAARSVTSAGPVTTADVTWFEGGGYSQDEIVGSLIAFFKQAATHNMIWVSMHNFGWIITDAGQTNWGSSAFDPNKAQPGDVVEDFNGGAHVTWQDILDKAEDPQPFKRYNLSGILTDPDFVSWCTSHDDEEVPDYIATLVAEGREADGRKVAADRGVDFDSAAYGDEEEPPQTSKVAWSPGGGPWQTGESEVEESGESEKIMELVAQTNGWNVGDLTTWVQCENVKAPENFMDVKELWMDQSDMPKAPPRGFEERASSSLPLSGVGFVLHTSKGYLVIVPD